MGPQIRFPAPFKFRVVGIFESGFYDIDSAFGHSTSLSFRAGRAWLQATSSIPSNSISDDIYKGRPKSRNWPKRSLGQNFPPTTWMEQYHPNPRSALSMERIVTAITIGLIEIVAALNILITLIMMVMEKNREIAVF